ncbi:MAG: cytochrome b/b6 domain-containing protein [Bacteriovoracaceae bacterium]|nr:cytochrome b/b6 domain-containing protein [Bacteriovoracaceae bacterium]
MKTWNGLTRIIHWLVATSVFANFLLDGEEDIHHLVGYLAAIFVLIRLIWGFVTTDKAHFKHFPLHFKNFSKDFKMFQGHNPIASWVYLFIWVLILLLGLSGYLMGTDAFWGESWLEELHAYFALALKVLVLVHLIGLSYDSWKYKRKTWLGMIHGRKQ